MTVAVSTVAGKELAMVAGSVMLGDAYRESRDSGARTPPRRRRGATTCRRSPDKVGLLTLRWRIVLAEVIPGVEEAPIEGPPFDLREYQSCEELWLVCGTGRGSWTSFAVGGLGSLGSGNQWSDNDVSIRRRGG